MTAEDVIRDALDLMRERGWRQSVPLGENDRTLCANQALAVAGDGSTEYYHLRAQAALMICDAHGIPVEPGMAIHALTIWNDDPARTWPEVEAAFLNALELKAVVVA